MFRAVRSAEDECVFCQREKEGLELEWKNNSFPPGVMCWTCLKKATRMLSRNNATPNRRASGKDAAKITE